MPKGGIVTITSYQPNISKDMDTNFRTLGSDSPLVRSTLAGPVQGASGNVPGGLRSGDLPGGSLEGPGFPNGASPTPGISRGLGGAELPGGGFHSRGFPGGGSPAARDEAR
jgi:hypothetical protein